MVVTLEEALDIDAVVVVGYGVQKKANLSGAVATVKMDEVLGDVRSRTSQPHSRVPSRA